MKLYRTEGVVLRTYSVREADKVLVLFSRDLGKLRLWAHGVAKPGSHKRGAVQPFCHGQFLVAAGREIDTVRQAEALDGHSHLHTDLVTLTRATYACELVEGFGVEGQPNVQLYVLLLETLGRLGTTGDDPLLLPAFEARLLDLSGFRPELKTCLECGAAPDRSPLYFSPLLGGIQCTSCHTGDDGALTVSLGSVRTLESLRSLPLDRLSTLRPDAGTSRELTRMLRNTISLHLEKQPKSLSFLADLTTFSPKA
ncbi:MAG: DNA repair protein RecO [Clostridia bacterium]|nr:DNA repair protein RecO [Clostridia bacterium]MDQ7790703.1 DNA repair protein RecO [Clostridia bacterium]